MGSSGRRVRRIGLSVLVVPIALGSLGCAGGLPARPSAPLPPPRSATLEEIRAAYDAYCHGIETLSASGDLQVQDTRTGKSQRLSVRFVGTRGGRLYLKGSVAVVTALEVISNGQRFWLQVPSKKTVWTGSTDVSTQTERSEAPYYALRPADVTLAFLPEPLDRGPDEQLVLESDRQSFSLTLCRTTAGSGYVRRRVVLRRDSLEWAQTRSFDEHGELVTDVSLAGWREGRPREVAISRPGEGYVASFSLDKFEVNVPVPERAFAPRTPDGYKLVEVQ